METKIEKQRSQIILDPQAIDEVENQALMNEIYDEVKDLRGYLVALRIKFPDLEIRLKHSIFILTELLENPTWDWVKRFEDDMSDLRSYLDDLVKIDQDMKSQIFPVVLLINRLMS